MTIIDENAVWGVRARCRFKGAAISMNRSTDINDKIITDTLNQFNKKFPIINHHILKKKKFRIFLKLLLYSKKTIFLIFLRQSC